MDYITHEISVRASLLVMRSDPVMPRQMLAKRTTAVVAVDDARPRSEHLESLQSQSFVDSGLTHPDIWASGFPV